MEIKVEISQECIDDLLERAGILYWARPIGFGDELKIVDLETDKEYTITNTMIQNGLIEMSQHSPHTFGTILSWDHKDDNTDMNTGDILIQYAIFGEVMYG